LPQTTVVIKAAAVADFRPARIEKHKIKRRRGELKLELEPTADLLEEVAREKGSRLLVGFAAESENVVENARLKLETKQLDLVVANDITREGAGFDGDTNIVTLLSRDGRQTDLPKMSKQAVADLILDEVVRLRSRVESGRAQSLPR
jgi:phosphopantothenoylcysteine decarboxylase/phosphopantothenate--cysteine ligase